MVTYLVRRLFQMVFVLLVVTFVSYTLFYVAPGGPLAAIGQLQGAKGGKIREEDLVRVMQQYELDLYHVPRFLRWIIGEPRGPITIFGQEILGALEIGCLKEGQAQRVYPDGRVETTNCVKPVYLKDLVGRTTTLGILRFDFGRSQQISRGMPVMDLLGTRIVPTLVLMGISELLALLIAVPIGIYSAVKQYSRFDYFITTVTFVGSAMPTLFLGVMAILVFGLLFKDIGLPFLPAQGATSNVEIAVPLFGMITPESIGDKLWHLAMPVGVLTFVNLAGWSRFIRSSMLEVLRQDYIRTARSKGLEETTVILKHALRNALIPFVTLVVTLIPAVFGGAIITESVFSWPGMGRLYIEALNLSDYPVAMATLMISTFLTLFAFLLSDLLYPIVDPRIRLN